MSDFSTDVSTTSVTDLSKRVRYSTGLVLGVDEFEQEQAYFIERDRLLTRALHGYGVVQGLEVGVDTDGELPKIVVGPGVAVTPEGQHVCVEREQCAVINDWLAAQSTDLIDGASDTAELCISVVLRYGTCTTDFVPVSGEPCRSTDDTRVASRLADDFSLVLEPASDCPPQAEERAVRLLGEIFRALEVRDDGRPVDEQTVKNLVAAVPDAAFSIRDDGTVVAHADARFDDLVIAAGAEGAAGLVKEADGGPQLRVQPGEATAMLQAAETEWVTNVRRTVLHAGYDDDADPLRAGDRPCQPVPKGDNGVVLGTFCITVEPQSDAEDSGLQPASSPNWTPTTRDRAQLLSTRVLQEARSGALDRVRSTNGDSGPDDTLRGEDAGGDLDGTYPSPTVAGLRGTKIREMDPDEITEGEVLTWDAETGEWKPAVVAHPEPEVPEVPEPKVQGNLTRIVATSWTHGARYSDPKSLEIELEGPRGDTQTLSALAVAFGKNDTDVSDGLDVDGPGRVETMGVTEEVFRAFLELEVNEFTGMGAPGLASRVRLRPEAVFPLSRVTVEDGGRGPEIVQAEVAMREQQRFARGAVLILPDSFADVLPQAIRGRVEVDVRGEFLTDEDGRAVDGTFVTGELPTGRRPYTDESGTLGVQGGRFESWFYARLDTDTRVDLNTAGREELMILPNVGSVIADRIIDYRSRLERPIESPSELTEVDGLTLGRIEDWEGLVRV